jgi:outer membrane lipopolysaccharide assembly protein LptE/RlpB
MLLSDEFYAGFYGKMKTRCAVFLLCALATGFLLPVACGYRMVGSGSLPGDIKTLAVNMLNNRTAETGLETVVTNALVVELNRRRKGLVVDPEKAEAILSGTVTSLGKQTVTRRSTNITAERTVTMAVSLKLTKTDGRVLWQKENIQVSQSYPVNDTSKAATEGHLNYAIGQVAQRLAEIVMQELVQDF